MNWTLGVEISSHQYTFEGSTGVGDSDGAHEKIYIGSGPRIDVIPYFLLVCIDVSILV